MNAGGTGSRSGAVLLDALGTLIELVRPWPLLRRTLHARHGIEIAEEQARDALRAEMAYYREHHLEGHDTRSLADLRRRSALVLRENLPEAGDLNVEEVTEVLLDSLRFTPFPDAAPALAELRALGMRLAVVSNWDCSLRGILAELGLAGAVDAIVVSAELGSCKPETHIFEAALEQVGCGAGETLFVGDQPETDIAGARAAGLRPVLVNRGALAADDS
ncbi:hypothetical protein LCGC14_3161800, partial [marine sediment metagenome]